MGAIDMGALVAARGNRLSGESLVVSSALQPSDPTCKGIHGVEAHAMNCRSF